MRLSGSSKVVMAAGSQGLFFCFLLIHAWALPQPVQSSEQQEKISSGPLNCFYFMGFLSPRAKLTNLSSQHHPPTHFPNQTHCPHPQISLQLYYKQIYLSNFKNFGSKKTLGQLSWGKVGMLVRHMAVARAHPSQFLALYCTSSHNPIQSTKQVHKF